MSVSVDIATDALRAIESSALASENRYCVGVVGIPPRGPRESFIWNRPMAARTSQARIAISMAEAWTALSDEQPGTFEWVYDSGDTGSCTLIQMIGEVIAQNVPATLSNKTVVAVDNQLSEERQEVLLQSLGSAGITDVDLLWRPIAIVLAHLDAHPAPQYRDGDKILVVDAESTTPEVTCIEIKEHNGVLLPLRHMPEHGKATYEWGGYALRRRIAEAVAEKNSEVANQLLSGPFASEFVAFTEGRECSDVWCRLGAEHIRVELSTPEAKQLGQGIVRGISIETVLAEVAAVHDIPEMTAVLWHGWPFRRCGGASIRERSVIVPPDAIVKGADVYASRLLAGMPTYLDTLPGLYILSEVKELKTFAYFPLVVAGVHEGGRIWRLPEPLTRFSITKGVSEFPAVLRRSDDSQCRRVVTPIPAPTEDTPVLIRGEMKPAHGRAKVTIEGAEGHERLFGDVRAVTLDWKRMTPIDDPLVTAPAVYPVRGRLFDADGEYDHVLREFLANKTATVNSKISYRGHSFPFKKLMEPWGYNPPWHNGRWHPPGWQEEPTRGMFGAEFIPYDTELLSSLAERIERTAKAADKPRLLNYMFVYAPETFKSQLRKKFSLNDPTINSYNWVYAAGRVFSSSIDFEVFIDFILRKANGRFPVYPTSNYTSCYWWSFFRCFCYHRDAINVSAGKTLQVLRLILNHVATGGVTGNTAKYCLCAILFSLRMRTRFPDFLQPGDLFCDEIVSTIANLPQLPYPPAMLRDVADPFAEGLNGLATRFLLQTASEEDLRALEGLTTSMN